MAARAQAAAGDYSAAQAHEQIACQHENEAASRTGAKKE